MDDLHAVFKELDGEYLRFDRIENPKHPRPDLCAFLMLHELLGGKGDMVCAAAHDEVYLDVDCHQLAKVASREFIRDLVRCGLRLNSAHASLYLFV